MEIFNSKIKEELKELRKQLEPTGIDPLVHINNFNIENIPIGDLKGVAQALYSKLQQAEESLSKKQNGINKTEKNIIPLLTEFDTNLRNFTAIDFETATSDRMTCQIGIVVVRNYEIVHEKCFLIKPPKNYYSKNCIDVHKITPEMTETAPTFDELWMDIENYLENQTIIAHNLQFDLDVLNKNINYYGLTPPNIAKSICTMEIFGGSKLDEVCKSYGIDIINHHDGLCDARACANIYIKHLKGEPHADIIKSRKKLNIRIPTQKENEERKISHATKVQDLSCVSNCNTIFYNKKVVISGLFKNFESRESLALKLKLLGADVNGSISSKTQIFIYGEDYGPKKMEKVLELNSSGKDIILMDEDSLYKELNKI